MMNFLRTKLRFLIWFVAIIFASGLFLMGGRAIGQNWITNIMPLWLLVQMPGCAESAGIVMKIGNYSVKIDEYKRIRENSIALARQQYGENFDTYTANVDFTAMAIESITQYAILLQEADRRDIYISKGELEEGKRTFPYWVPNEVRSRVMPYPYYLMSRSDGAFDPDKYSNALDFYGKITPKDFSKEVENGLRIARLKDLLNQSAMVTDLEIQQEYKKRNVKATIKYVETKYADFTEKVEIDDAELNDFFQENMLNYKTQDKVSISFIKIDPKQLERTIDISPQRVANYYGNRKKDYFEPEKVDVAHILVEAGASASEEDKVKAKALAEKILEEARNPAAILSALANKYNKELFKVKYENLRPFERGKMEPAFEEAAFGLPVGDIGGVVETNYGYHVIKIEDRTPARTKLLSEVKYEIERKLKKEQAVQDAWQKADDIQYDTMAEQDLQIAVDANPELNLKITETGLFAKTETIPNVGAYYTYRDISEEAFKLKKGEISKLVEIKTPNDEVLGYYIFKLVDKKAGGLPELENVKNNMLQDLRTEKARKLAMEAAKTIMATREPDDDNLDKIAEKNDLEIGESEPFALSGNGYIRGKPFSLSSKTIMLKAFGMEIDEIAGPLEGSNGVYIIQLVGQEEFDSEKFAEAEQEKKELRNQLLQQRQRKIFDTWYQKLRLNAKIKSFIAMSS